jgi:hypothetical protein
VLNSEEVLKAIVSRKCLQQNLGSQSFNMQDALMALNKECEDALELVKGKKRRGKEGEDIQRRGRSGAGGGLSPSSSASASASASAMRDSDSSSSAAAAATAVGPSSPSGPSVLKEVEANTVFTGGTELSHISAQKSEIDSYLDNSRQRATQTKDFLASMRAKILQQRDVKMAAAALTEPAEEK